MVKLLKFLLIFIFLFSITAASQAAGLDERLRGYIVLQVEQNGEAWYVHPRTGQRYFLGRPDLAWQVMREQGTGISNADLARIPLGLVPALGVDSDFDGLLDELENALMTDPGRADSDNDGISDKEELSFNYDPLGPGRLPLDADFARAQAGRIFLQVENHGEAWYVYPKDNKRYYLGRPADALSLMRALGLGISNADIGEISPLSPAYDISGLESRIFALVNRERQDAGLAPLAWNSQLAAVARRHSTDLADENKAFTTLGRTCDYPIIHHEGLESGLYNSDRLHHDSIYYFLRTGENIALVAGAYYTVSYLPYSPVDAELSECDNYRHQQEQEFLRNLEKAKSDPDKKAVIKRELLDRTALYEAASAVEIGDIEWRSEEEVALETVRGWM